MIDLETTGLYAEVHEPIQIGAVRFRLGEDGTAAEIESFDQLVDPGTAVPEAITILTGLSDRDVAGRPKLADALPPLLAFLRGDPILLGHNAPFDAGFLAEHMSHEGVPLPDASFFDTRKLVRTLFPEIPKPRLARLIELWKLGGRQEHTGLSDARYTMRVFERIVAKVASATGKPIGELTPDDLAAFSAPITFAAAWARLARNPAIDQRPGPVPEDFEKLAECISRELHEGGRPAALRDVAEAMGVDRDDLRERLLGTLRPWAPSSH